MQGDLADALSLCEVVVRSNRDQQPAFQMYRRLYNSVHGRDVPHAAISFCHRSRWLANSSMLMISR